MSAAELAIRIILSLDLASVGVIWGREMWGGVDADSFIFGFFKALAIVAVANVAVIAIFGLAVLWTTR